VFTGELDGNKSKYQKMIFLLFMCCTESTATMDNYLFCQNVITSHFSQLGYFSYTPNVSH